MQMDIFYSTMGVIQKECYYFGCLNGGGQTCH